MREDELFVAAKELQAPYELVQDVAENGKLPVVNFVAGGIATPADAALAMQLGAEGVFVGSGIFKSEDPARTAHAIVQATTHFDDPQDHRRGLEGPGSADARHRDRSDPRAGAAGGPRLVATPGIGADRYAASRATADEDRRPGAPGRLRRAHRDPRARSASRRVPVRLPRDLEGVSGLILPGGESTTMRKLIDRWGLREPILELAARARRSSAPAPA